MSRAEVFTKVAAHGSLSKAALQLGTTSSAVSRQMARLEEECGGRLFHRTGRGVTLTELGQRILPRVQSLLQEARALDAEIAGGAGQLAGEVRLGLLAAPAASLLPPLFRALQERHPAIRLRAFEGSTGQMDEWIASGHVDIGLVARQSSTFAPHEHPLATSHSHVVAAAGHPLVQGATVELSALAGVPLILPGAPNGMRRVLEQMMKQRGWPLTVAMEADSLLVQVAMARHGCGCVILPRHAVTDWLNAGILGAARIVNPGLARTVVLTLATQRPATRAVREVHRLIRLVVEDLIRAGDGVWSPIEP